MMGRSTGTKSSFSIHFASTMSCRTITCSRDCGGSRSVMGSCRARELLPDDWSTLD